MNFRLVDSGWNQILDEALTADKSRVRIICPFVKEKAAKRLLQYGRPKQLEVITRYDLNCFRDGVSDIAALRLLLIAGAKIRGIKNLHAKAYLIGADRAIVTSANLTEQGLIRNHEFGFFAQDEEIVANCHAYFERLWKMAGPDLSHSKLDVWDQKVTAALAAGAGTRSTPNLGDEGKEVGLAKVLEIAPSAAAIAEQGFVKFFGEGHRRLERFIPVIDEVNRAGCHWACSYPKAKRPRQVRDGALLFMGRLVDHPKDIMIFGRAIGMKHVYGRDDATDAEIKKRPFKAKWPRYIRVHDAEFVNGTLGDGVSLNELMDDLGAKAFASTKRHLEAGSGNTNPRTAYAQQAHVELTPEAIRWLNSRLDGALKEHGKISPAEFGKLDWPKLKF